MKQKLLLTILILVFVIHCAAQRNTQKSATAPRAQMVKQLTFSDLTELSIHIERFAKTLRKKPIAKAYVIVYERRLTNEYMQPASFILDFAKRELRRAKIASNRIVGTEGGFREDLMVELFIVPRGAVLPVPTPTIDAKGINFKN